MYQRPNCTYRFCAVCGTKFTTRPDLRAQTCSGSCRGKLARRNYKKWHPREIEILKDIAESMPSHQLVRAFNCAACGCGFTKRTTFSVWSKMKDLGLSLNTKYCVYTTTTVAETLGISVDTVRSWFRPNRKNSLKFYKQRQSRCSTKYTTTKSLRDFARANPQCFGGIDFIDLYILLEDIKLVEYITENFPRRNKPACMPRKVRCVETGQIFDSQADAAKAFFVSETAIYTAIKHKRTANNHHFERINP